MSTWKPKATRRQLMAGVGAAAVSIGMPAILRAQSEPVRIGALNPLTGAGGSYGPSMRKAIELGVEEINAAGGLLGGRMVELYGEDTQTNPDPAVRAARKLIDADRVIAILGTWASSVTTAVAPLCWESKTMIACVSGSDTITLLPHEGYLIRTQPNSTLQMDKLAEFVGAELGAKRVFILGAQTPFAKPNEDHLRANLPKHGSELVGALVYDKDKTSFRSEIDIALQSDPDMIYLNGYTPDVTVVMKDLYKAGYDQGRVAQAYAVNQKLLESLPAEVTEAVYTIAPSPAVNSDAYRRLSEKLAITDLDPYSCQTNDHIALTALAIEQAGEASGEAIKDSVRKISQGDGVEVDNITDGLKALRDGQAINYTGASGPCDFTDIGDILDTQFRYEVVEGGAFKTLKVA
jgi:ABC-type branched-subunit amino acid transport system substrate-binding protein